MGRAPCCEKIGLRRGRWTAEEDQILSNYIQAHGEGSWRSLPKNAGLLRCGKSCRLRWINYLRSGVKRGNISAEEEDTIIKLHASLGNRWSLIAGHLAGRTDNEIKNYWNSHLSRKITPNIPTRRRPSAVKLVKKPRKTSSKPSPEKLNNINHPSGGDGVMLPDSSTHVVLTLPEQQKQVVENSGQVVEISGSTSSSTNDSSKVDRPELEWEWESEWNWDFEGGNGMLGLGGEEEDGIMSWPWESPTQVGVDIEKQDEMIAWLLS